MAVQLPEELVALLKDRETCKVLATVDDTGAPHVVFKFSLTVLEDGNLVYPEAIESSHTNSNMFYSLWFDKKVAVTVRGKNRASFQIKGKPVRYDFTSARFKEFYRQAKEREGPDADLSGLWYIEPETVRYETFATRKADEERKHPFARHLDRPSPGPTAQERVSESS